MRTFQQYTADINEVVTELRKKGLLAEDVYKNHKIVEGPAGKRISILELTEKINKRNYSIDTTIKEAAISTFMENNPKAVSEKTMQKIKPLTAVITKNSSQ